MSHDSPSDPRTILVVEDESHLAELYATWLQERYQVRTASDGEEALERLGTEVDIVLLDRRMPGLSGDEVLQEIREGSVDCRVAMVTAVEPDFDIIRMGFDDYLVKPVTREDLETTVQTLSRRSEYSNHLDEYVTLVSKRATLEREKPEEELRTSEEFERLESRIEELESVVDPMVQSFDANDTIAAFRDL